MRHYEDYELPSAAELAEDEEPRPPCAARRCWQDHPPEEDEPE